MTDPHANDYCVVCNRSPEVGMRMHPVDSLTNAYVCGKCKDHGVEHLPWGETDE